MSKIVTRMVAAAAALGLVAAPIVANANTRAGDSAATYSVSGPGLGRAADGEGQGEGGGGGIILGVFAAAAIISGILIATDVLGDDDDDCASPGAC